MRVLSVEEIHAVSGSASSVATSRLADPLYLSGLLQMASNFFSGVLLVGYLFLTGRTIADVL